MKNWLKKIKEKDDHEKQAFAFWSATIITFLIFAVWLFSTVYSFEDKILNKEKSATPIQSIKNLLK